jgi:uncharacterized peroxidase-related enzyme
VTWIKTVRLAEADPSLCRAMKEEHKLYPPEYDAPVFPGLDDEIAGIVAAHTLIPDALYHAFATFGVLMSPDLPLSRSQHEMIATVVSASNQCFYCTGCHTEFLRRVTLDEKLAQAIRTDHRTAPISAQDRVMLDYAKKLTLESHRMTPQDHERLRAAGFDDKAILQITMIAAWFNYINRIASSLGVGLEARDNPG